MNGVLLLAQADIPPWAQTTVLGAIVALFVWWIRYNTAVAIPKINQENRKHVEVIAASHASTVEKLVSEFRAENKENRIQCAEEKRLLFEKLHPVRPARPQGT